MFEYRVKETPKELAKSLIDLDFTEDMFVGEGIIYTLLDQNQIDLKNAIDIFDEARNEFIHSFSVPMEDEEIVFVDENISKAKKFLRDFMVINYLAFNEDLEVEPTANEIESAKSIIWDMANVMIKHSHFYNMNDVETISEMEDTIRVA